MTRSVGTTLGKMWRRMIQALERPATTASATKSCSLMASVSPRICRAKRGQSRSAITRTTLRKLGSATATSTAALHPDGRDQLLGDVALGRALRSQRRREDRREHEQDEDRPGEPRQLAFRPEHNGSAD